MLPPAPPTRVADQLDENEYLVAIRSCPVPGCQREKTMNARIVDPLTGTGALGARSSSTRLFSILHIVHLPGNANAKLWIARLEAFSSRPCRPILQSNFLCFFACSRSSIGISTLTVLQSDIKHLQKYMYSTKRINSRIYNAEIQRRFGK